MNILRKNMTLIEYLRAYNQWRRGKNCINFHPKEVCLVIDEVIEILESQDAKKKTISE